VNAELARLADEAAALAAALPPAVLRGLAEALMQTAGEDAAYLRHQALQVTPHPHFRALLGEFLDAWQRGAPRAGVEACAAALLAALAATARARQEQSVELVWTGPDVAGMPLRRTDQALLEVIDTAQRSLLIVSFAVYKVPAVAEAIVRAAVRGVAVSICLEAPEPSDQRMGYDTIQALGPQVQACAAVYVWPRERRPVDAHGNAGLLHAKCAVADERMLFVSSANLTEHAMNLNMELGVLIQGGRLPASVARQFLRMLEVGILRRVTP